MRSALSWAFRSRAHLTWVAVSFVSMLMLLVILNITTDGQEGPAAQPKASASPTPTDPGEWLASDPAPTPSTSASDSPPPSAVDEMLTTAKDFVAVFTDASVPADRWRADTAALATPELADGLAQADPSKVPVYVGEPAFEIVGRGLGGGEVTATYEEGEGLRVLLTYDGQRWAVANVLPVA
jgi:hypothetical protein